MTDDTEDLSHLSQQAQCFVLALHNFGKPNGIQPTESENLSPEECFCMAMSKRSTSGESKPYWQALRNAGFESSASEAINHGIAHARADKYLAQAEMAAIDTETNIMLRRWADRLGQ